MFQQLLESLIWVFFVTGLSGSERANLINLSLQRLWDTGADVFSVTLDGPSRHFSMPSELGAQLRLPGLEPIFLHPVNGDKKVQIYLEVCHIWKLIRNTLSDVAIALDAFANKIMWQYIENLHKLQHSEGPRLGNKLQTSDIQWRQQK